MQQRLLNGFSWYSITINKIIFYTCGITLAVLFLERLGIIFSYEGHTAGIDNNFDYPIIRSLAGYSLYPNPSAYPFAVNPYAPLFFIICKSAALIFHIQAIDTISVYRISRSVALLADTGTGILIFLILRKLLKASMMLTISVIALFFCVICFLGYTINRSDSLFLFFYCGTLFVLIRRSFAANRLQPLITAVLVTLCIYSKQNGISLLLLVPVWFAQEKDYRSLLQFLFLTFFFCAGLFVYFEYYYTDHFFSEHIIHALKNKIDPRWFYIYVFKLTAGSYLTLPLAVSFIISVRSIAGNSNQLLKKLGWFFFLQFFFSTALCFKWGSSQGYYNESFLTAFIVIAAFYKNTISPKLQLFVKLAGMYTYPALLVMLIHVTAQLFFFFLNSKAEAKEKFNEQVEVSNYIRKEIGIQNRYVIDLSGADFNFFKNLLYKECAAPNIDAVSCCTLPAGIFDYSELLSDLKTGKILFLIERKDFSPGSLWGVDIEHFKEDTTFKSYRICKYDPSKLNR